MDSKKLRYQREAEEQVPDFLELGDEEAFVAAVKRWKKDISPEELQQFILLFRDAMREKRGLPSK